MGHKGVSKRKPKKDRPLSNNDIGGSSNMRSGERATVQSVVRDNRTALNSGGVNPSAGSNKKHKKGS